MPTIPTVGFNLEEVTVGGVKLTIWDCGGQEKVNIFIFLHAITSASQKKYDKCPSLQSVRIYAT